MATFFMLHCHSQFSRVSSAAALKRALVDDATAMKLEQAHSQAPVDPSNSTVAINEHAPNAGSGHVTAETVAKNQPSTAASASKTSASSAAAAPAAAPVQTVDYGRKLFEIDNVCSPRHLKPCCSCACAGTLQDSLGYSPSSSVLSLWLQSLKPSFRKVFVLFARKWREFRIKNCRWLISLRFIDFVYRKCISTHRRFRLEKSLMRLQP